MVRGCETRAPELRGTEESAVDFLPALSIALDHPTLSSSPRVMCAAARACKAWRQAVRQCNAHNTAVVLHSTQPLDSFAQWMPKHAALIESITVLDASSSDQPEENAAAQQLLQQALLEAAQAQNPGAAGAAAAVAAVHVPTNTFPGSNNSRQQQRQQQQQQQHGWCLAKFHSDLPGAPALLRLLPGHSLTHLHLELQPGPAAAAALPELSQIVGLSSLQELHVESLYSHKPPAGFFAGIAQLSRLTSLKVEGKLKGFTRQLWHALQQPLPLQELEVDDTQLHQLPSIPVHLIGIVHEVDAAGDDDKEAALPSLLHLTQLTKLSIPHSKYGGAALPAQLQSLQLHRCNDTAPLLALSQLRHLTICPNFAEQHAVLELAKLPALQVLRLDYNDDQAAAAAAPMWALLPQLRGLDVTCDSPPNRQSRAAILAGAAAATQLTDLMLLGRDYASEDALPQEQAMAICGRLTGLTSVRELALDSVCIVPGDAVALTALTGLTCLQLDTLHHGVGEVAATALARSLQHLQHLELRSCSIDLGSTEFLAAVGQLRQLTELNLEGNDGLTQQGLMQLTGLSRLEELYVDEEKRC